MEQSHARTLGSRGEHGLFYFDEGGIQERLRGPGYNPSTGKIANAVLGLKALDIGPSGDQHKVEMREIAKLAGWEGRLQQMDEKRQREKAALAAPPVGVGSSSSLSGVGSSGSAGAPAPVVYTSAPPIGSGGMATDQFRTAPGEDEVDPVARADALVRGDSVYSELESKYRSV
jgi:hypothetical protein